MEENQKENQNGSITWGNFKYQPKSKEEVEKLKYLGTLLNTKSKHKKLTEDSLYGAICAAGLEKTVLGEFKKTIKKEKIKAILGLAADIGMYMILENYELPPVAETIGYFGVAFGAVYDSVRYVKSKMMEIRIDSILEGIKYQRGETK